MRTPNPSPVAVLAALSVACGGSGSATAKLMLRNDTPSTSAPTALRAAPTAALAVPATTALVGIKLIAVYLAEDVDPVTQNNVGNNSMIWLNSQCQDDISTCNVSGAAGSYSHRVTDFFNFAQGTAAVNAALNSQGRPVEAGTYRYVRMEFCKMDPGTTLSDPNVEWKTPDMAQPRAFATGSCGVTSKPFDPPLVLKGGDAVSVTVGYDLTNSLVRGTPDNGPGGVCFGTGASQVCYMDCVDDPSGGTRTCFNSPEFTPSATAGL